MRSLYHFKSNQLIIGLDDGRLVFFDAVNLNLLSEAGKQHEFEIATLEVIDDCIFSASKDGTILKTKISNPTDCEIVFSWRDQFWKRANFWGIKNSQAVYYVSQKYSHYLKSIRKCDISSRLIISGYEGTVFIVDYEEKTVDILGHLEIKDLNLLGKAHFDTVFDTDFHEAANLIATCGGAGHAVVIIWSYREHEPIKILSTRDKYYGSIIQVKFLPNTNSILAIFENECFAIWNENGEPKFFETHIGELRSLCIAPKNDWFALGSQDGVLQTYSTVTQKLIDEIKIGESPIRTINISAENLQIANELSDSNIVIINCHQDGHFDKDEGSKFMDVNHLIDRLNTNQLNIKPFLNSMDF